MKSSDELNPVLRRILEQRGITGADLEEYLNPALSRLADGGELPGVPEASDIILAAVEAGQKIVVFGDYDCDGVCATAILIRAIIGVGGKVEPFLPERMSEGYGMSDAAIARMLREYPDVGLVVTVDNGINSVDQVAQLKAKGVDVVITDHHLPGEKLPDAKVIVDPKVRSSEKLATICGAAVAFYLSGYMVKEARRRGREVTSLGGFALILAGLATVTDIMPLVGQNRILVAEALWHFTRWAPIGLRELYQRSAKSAHEAYCSHDFSFVLGPRINAAGRLDSAMASLELLMCDDYDIAYEAARIIDLKNTERKEIEQRMTDEAFSKIVPGASAQVIYMPDGHPGVAGIVAARLHDKLGENIPVCVYAGGHGSARSSDRLNIRDAFVACKDVLDSYGGHAAAGGFSVKEGKVDEFRRLLCEYCDKLAPSLATESEACGLKADIWVETNELSLELAEEVRKVMEPFGDSNAEPIFGLRNVMLKDVKTLGIDNRHLVTSINGLRTIWWVHGSDVEDIRAKSSSPFDVTVLLNISDYGERHLELRIVSLAPSESVQDKELVA